MQRLQMQVDDDLNCFSSERVIDVHTSTGWHGEALSRRYDISIQY